MYFTELIRSLLASKQGENILRKSVSILIFLFVTLLSTNSLVSSLNASYTHQDLTFTVLINGNDVSLHNTKDNPLIIDIENDIEIDFDIANSGETVHLIDVSFEVYTIQEILFLDQETKVFTHKIDVDNNDVDADGKEGFDIASGMSESSNFVVYSEEIKEYKEQIRGQRVRVDINLNFEIIPDYFITVYLKEGTASEGSKGLFDLFKGIQTSQLIIFATISAIAVSFTVILTNKEFTFKVVKKFATFCVAIGTVVRPPAVRNLKKDEILTNDIREKMYDYIINNEGAHFREIIDYVDIGPFAGVWHLQVLEDFGFINSHKYKQYKIYYPRGRKILPNDPRLILKSNTAKAIVLFISKNPGAYQTLIAKNLGKAQGTIRYNMKTLVDAKIINIIIENGQKKFFINKKNRVLQEILPEITS
jgi:predicted transcriptional regulator